VNIIEAMKSGKWFRRKGKTSWYSPISDNYPLMNICAISRENFFADDWEIESTPVTITREQFNAAWDKALDESALRGFNCFALHHCLTKELGL
jgi:hypothetical protein